MVRWGPFTKQGIGEKSLMWDFDRSPPKEIRLPERFIRRKTE
jgi:hypothetical protein